MKVRKDKGFTLIELLAVIVILGLLMAIAIPSVTKYITESRKKTLTTTLGNYIGALVNDVNDLSYTFKGTYTIYAVPIECIALERGGTNPFGHWYQANDAYFAYVLVQYDDEASKYVYGFTFKDSAGYGLYPTIQPNIKEKGSQIKTGYTINKPVTGDLTSLVTLAKWQESGFKVDSTTNLHVLEATSEDAVGDGIKTCTLQQKGDNYAQVQQEKEDAFKNNDLMACGYGSTEAFWGYKSKIKTITFENKINIPNEISDEHKWDVSVTGNGKVMAYIKPNASDSTYYDLYIQGDGKLYANPDSSYLFHRFSYVDSINNIELLNTSKVTNMASMFSNFGANSNVLKLDLGNNFDTSNVTDMSSMFSSAGKNSPNFILNLGDKFDTSKVTNMASMFNATGFKSTVFTLDLGDKFDTSNVTRMQNMFQATGQYSNKFRLDCRSWNVDKVRYYYNFNTYVTSKVTPPNWVQ